MRGQFLQARRSWIKLTIITTTIAGLCLLLGNLSFWINNYIFDTNNFSHVATRSLTSESSTDAIASRVTEQALEGRPVAQRLAGNTVEKVIAGILSSDQAVNLLNKTSAKAHVYLTSKDRESVVINLAGVKDTITTFLDSVNRGDQIGPRIDSVPSEIVLIDEQQLPDFYKISLVFLWLGPLSLVILLVMLAYPHLVNRSHEYIGLVQGSGIIIFGLIGLLMAPLFRPMVLSNIPNPNSRIVVENLYNDFLAQFNHQLTNTIIVGLIVIFVAAASIMLRKYRSSLGITQSHKK